jgi:hypothetical protein
VDGSGNIVMTGSFSGTVNFGGSSLTSLGSWDIIVAKYTAGGGHVWSKRFGGTSLDAAYGVAIDGSDNVALTGYFVGGVDFGGGTLTGGGSYDIFVAKLSSTGTHISSQGFGAQDADIGYGIATDPVTGEITTTGYFYGTINLDTATLVSAGLYDVFLLKISP